MEYCIAQNKSLLIIADDVDGEALAGLIVNKARGTCKVAAIKAPEYGERQAEMLEDIAILTGGTFISGKKGMTLDKMSSDMFGTATKISIDNIQLMVAYATPQVPMMMPPMGTHRLTTSNVQEIALPSTSVNQTLTVPSSTFYLQAYVIDDTDAHSRAKGAISFHESKVRELQLRLAGSNYPTLPYESLNSLTNSDAVRCYADSVSARNRLDPDASYPKNFGMWSESPVISFNIFRAQNNTDTQLHIRCTLESVVSPAQHKLVIVSHYNELLGIEYANQEPVAIDLQPVV